MMFWRVLLVIILSYAIGSISFAYIVTKWRINKDIRTLGSGNAGFTNTMRVLPLPWAITVFLGDLLKGSLAAVLGQAIAGEVGGFFAFFAVVAGHMWPFWLQFKGGKGIATGVGAALVMIPFSGWLGLLVFAIVLLATRYVSLASLLAAASVPLSALFRGEPGLYVLAFFIVVALIFYKHRPNIKRLLAGTEPRLNLRKK